MKKLLLFSAVLLGSAGFASAQTGKKATAASTVPQTQTVATPTSKAKKPARANAAKPMPASALSLHAANAATAVKKPVQKQ